MRLRTLILRRTPDSTPAPDYLHVAAVLVVGGDPRFRQALVEACCANDIRAHGVTGTGEVTSWRRARLVLTDLRHLHDCVQAAPRHVLVLVEDAVDGRWALQEGATGWIERSDEERTTQLLLLTLAALKGDEFHPVD